MRKYIIYFKSSPITKLIHKKQNKSKNNNDKIDFRFLFFFLTMLNVKSIASSYVIDQSELNIRLYYKFHSLNFVTEDMLSLFSYMLIWPVVHHQKIFQEYNTIIIVYIHHMHIELIVLNYD